jgi:hypothetical protein
MFEEYITLLRNLLQKELKKILQDDIANKVVLSRLSELDREIDNTLEGINILLSQLNTKQPLSYNKSISLPSFYYKLNLKINSNNISLPKAKVVSSSVNTKNNNAIAGTLTAFGNNLGINKIFPENKIEKRQRIKQLVIDRGLENFKQLEPDILEHIEQKNITSFDNSIKAYRQQITKAILILEILIK